MENYFAQIAQQKHSTIPIGCFLNAIDVYHQLQREKDASDVLTLYNQLKLQQILEKDKSIDSNVKQSIMYTNSTIINDLARQIDTNQINYPKSYQQIAKESLNNTIITAKQLRYNHLAHDGLNN